jgi:hypothetical protein
MFIVDFGENKPLIDRRPIDEGRGLLTKNLFLTKRFKQQTERLYILRKIVH